MNWINIETATLDSEEFVGSEPVVRATWLCLLRYCVGQENGGAILGCKSWSDRKWQQLARVTREEVLTESALWLWEGENLLVWAYPTDKQTEVQHKRERARINGLLGGRPPLNQPPKPAEPTPETNEEPTLVHSAKPEGKGMEGKGKEGEEKGNTPLAPHEGGGVFILADESDLPQKTILQVRAEKLFKRRLSTPWTVKEGKAWTANKAAIEGTTEDDWQALEAFYAFNETERHVVYRRQDLATLLNNWTGEVDKARDFKARGPKLKHGVPYVANAAQVAAETADFDSRYGGKGF